MPHENSRPVSARAGSLWQIKFKAFKRFKTFGTAGTIGAIGTNEFSSGKILLVATVEAVFSNPFA
jgi:hypothetical protein